MPEQGFIFCSFNHIYKITPTRFALWCRILAAVPGSALWLLDPEMAATKENLWSFAEARGISRERVIFAAQVSLTEHLTRLQLADLALDTYPCTSHTTASDALWAGVPLLTRVGTTFASRVPASLLRTMNMSDLVVESDEEFLARALAVAASPPELQALRARLADNREASPLYDAELFTRRLEALYRHIWRNEVAGQRRFIAAPELEA